MKMPPPFSDPQSRIIVALDIDDTLKANHFVQQLAGYVGYFKVGPELFLALGPKLFDWLPASQVMLDLKFHDIPETVERAMRLAVKHGVAMATLHIQQRETLRRVVEVTEGRDTLALGVTLLTSMGVADMRDLTLGYLDELPGKTVERRAALGYECGLRGFVCSPKEVLALNDAMPDATLVVPGIRYPDDDKGDQQRTGTPYDAIINGATALVVGRPIRDAKEPLAVVERITKDIERALLHRSRGSRVLSP